MDELTQQVLATGQVHTEPPLFRVQTIQPQVR